MANLIANASTAVNMDAFKLTPLGPGVFSSVGQNTISIRFGSGSHLDIAGSFTLDSQGHVTSGILENIEQTAPAESGGSFIIYGVFPANPPYPPIMDWLASGDTATALSTLLVGNDYLQASGPSGGNLLRGFAGNDRFATFGGSDTQFGGIGNDTLADSGVSGANYLRGDEGDDSISGGGDFDDINGNMGADTAHGNDGDDWVVGGQNNDLLTGDNGFDIVYGNLGDDTISGGAGVDWVRGGQGNDSVSGGDGDDWLWGDRGDDTISGGAGADIFHSFTGAGIDRITDFSLAQGDKVQLDPGTTYTTRQVGADTVIDITGGDQVILVGVQLSSLTGNWIFVA
jgi:Ca2+-binding RTX toxin-like protein